MASKLTAFRMTDADGYTRHGMDGEVKWEDGATVSPGEKGDNLRGALKAVRDQVATWLGVDDADPRVTWEYGQAVDGRPRYQAVRIEVET